MKNDSSSWVILDHGGRFSPTQQLAFPGDETGSESDGDVSPTARPRSFSLNKGLQLYEEGINHQSVGLKSSLCMQTNNSSEITLEIQELNRISGRSMLNLDNAALFFSRKDSESVTTGQIEFQEDDEIAKILSCPGLVTKFNIESVDPETSSVRRQLNPLYFSSSEDSLLPVEFFYGKPETVLFWLYNSCAQFLKFVHEFRLPLGLSHLLTLCVGFYLGKASVRLTK